VSSVNNNAMIPQLILFVTGDSPRSQRARTNLARALSHLGMEEKAWREINLLENPGKAIEYGIFATPALMDASDPDNQEVIYGDLSNESELMRYLPPR